MNDIIARAMSGAPFPSKASIRKAENVLQAMTDAGMVIAPREPTISAQQAGGDVIGQNLLDSVAHYPVETACDVWQAMIKAWEEENG